MNWHERIAIKMAHKDAHYAEMGRWFNDPANRGEIRPVNEDVIIPSKITRNYQPVKPKVVDV